MEGAKLIKITEKIPDTHFFIYKSQKFPFKFDFFQFTSNFFSDHEEEFRNTAIFPLLDEIEEQEQNISNETIKNFIDFVQRQEIPISKENAVHLNYLSIKYGIKELKKYTSEFIENHHQELVLDIFLINQHKRSFSTQIYEDIISEHFIEYIKDDRLL